MILTIVFEKAHEEFQERESDIRIEQIEQADKEAESQRQALKERSRELSYSDSHIRRQL